MSQKTLTIFNSFETMLNNIDQQIYTPIGDLNVNIWKTDEPVSYADRKTGDYKILSLKERWGDLFDCAWMNFSGEIPADIFGEKIVCIIDISGEANVVDEDGHPKSCLTTRYSNFGPISMKYEGRPVKKTVPILDKCVGGESFNFWIEAGNNDLFGNFQNNGILEEAYVAIQNKNIFDLFYDYEVLLDLCKHIEPKTDRYNEIYIALKKSSEILENFNDETVQFARDILGIELNKKNLEDTLLISASGHAHIDLAWLWPIRETVRKGARTFSHALQLIEEYDDYIFGASQPQLYQWMKDKYPELYDRVKVAIKNNRWEPLGGMWVESDTNIPNGESLVRQFLYGKAFFKKEFDIELKNLFLPDVFGYSGAIPQIMKKSGVDYFTTIKLSWDKFVKYPHETFFWQGIDGTDVLVHMPPEGTYNGPAAPRAIKKIEANYQDKDATKHALMIYGVGDGGGGPSRDHLERLERSANLDGISKVKHSFISDFFERLEKDGDKFQTWVGELYLGHHQGTLTTQGKSKWYNRKLEFAFRDLEYSSILSQLFSGSVYPSKEIEDMWKEVLLYQFHDIIPGSSIKRVYDESFPRYESMMKQTSKLTNSAWDSLSTTLNTVEFSNPVLVRNILSWERHEWLKFDENWKKVTIPSMGHSVIESRLIDSSKFFVKATQTSIENDLLKVIFDGNGTIISIFDKEQNREVLAENQVGNDLTVYEDGGDAWDFPVDYRENIAGQFELKKSNYYTDGPKVVMRQEREFGSSTLTQDIVLIEGSRKLDFITHVDWKEDDKMLRTSFSVDIYATEYTSEIQFGHVKRPTHSNTQWEFRQFENAAHKWVDLSQPDYGVALMNDCKYGHYVKGNVLDINLLRSPNWPDPTADRSEHNFTYSLFPHSGDHIQGEVVKNAYELNVPLKTHLLKSQSGELPPHWSFLSVDCNNVVVSSVKKSEDGNGIIVRLYEAFGYKKQATLSFGIDIKHVALTNLIEEEIEDLAVESNMVTVPFKPFEIQTIRLI
ncbi:MAG: alpha-mannosidase [Candidatus Marinimicrobia bacterium]|jgi:alpha-mannosidase|nr:alpha-mannosidase [Candidatus Neomarinimicrobiota bacterium]MBT3840156.1 alpha-mannosidase [Candidatus Neomarinimicrobiota bacterium]MBT3999150.1 alpha-mannosidase [Candidatus Neomarinimicrobiota bacterium]MBT4282586.1 alpha-mannosidase [Candidatus Neomarinimicrobiota bacterium]MBT4579682.1 alpha-mannosidase [Candidatus Neomarinimicrobiota bacterium]